MKVQCGGMLKASRPLYNQLALTNATNLLMTLMDELPSIVFEQVLDKLTTFEYQPGQWQLEIEAEAPNFKLPPWKLSSSPSAATLVLTNYISNPDYISPPEVEPILYYEQPELFVGFKHKQYWLQQTLYYLTNNASVVIEQETRSEYYVDY